MRVFGGVVKGGPLAAEFPSSGPSSRSPSPNPSKVHRVPVAGSWRCLFPAARSCKVDSGRFLTGAGETGGAAPGRGQEWVGETPWVKSCNPDELL